MQERRGSESGLRQVAFFWLQEGKSSKGVDDYDRSVRELGFERRGQALDRMKTEDELIKEEKDRLEKLEVRQSENVTRPFLFHVCF